MCTVICLFSLSKYFRPRKTDENSLHEYNYTTCIFRTNIRIEVDLDENYFTRKFLERNFLDEIKANYGMYIAILGVCLHRTTPLRDAGLR